MRDLIVPAYFHPSEPGWPALADPRVSTIIFNAASGPGTVRDPALATTASRLTAAGVALAGYVDTAYGRRPPAEVGSDLRRYRDWYGITRVFCDQVSAEADLLPAYRRISGAARDAGAETLVFNHGAHPDARYAGLADTLITFEGPWSAYARLRVPAWAAGVSAGHLVYGVPEGMLERVVALAAERGAGVGYVTDAAGANPWRRLPPYFAREVALVAGG